ncbi:MAG: GIY-YIG nuclease family protein [Candidatus Yanofskybacteria bacterium]|nr:GIY-YIG nuclease family protein [Candidatus Yanofskybacteria bacterium]
MWIVYIIQNNLTEKIYIGCTNDLKKRVEKHNSQTNKGYTRRLIGQWILIYAEAYRSKEDAFRRESKLKDHGSSKHELKKRISNSLLKPKVRLD